MTRIKTLIAAIALAASLMAGPATVHATQADVQSIMIVSDISDVSAVTESEAGQQTTVMKVTEIEDLPDEEIPLSNMLVEQDKRRKNYVLTIGAIIVCLGLGAYIVRDLYIRKEHINHLQEEIREERLQRSRLNQKK